MFGFLEIPVLFWRSLASSFVVPLPQVEEFEYLRVFITSYRRVEKETSGRWISCVFLPSSTLTNYHLHLLKAPACLYSLRSFDSVADEFICFSCVRIADNNLSPPIFHVTSCRFFFSYNFILLTELV